MATMVTLGSPKSRSLPEAHKIHASMQMHASKTNQVGTVILYGVPIVSLVIENQERLCLAQISNTLLKEFSYNEIHNRRVALGITCVQCTPVQLEILRRAGAMPVSSRRCGMITRREAERLCKSFLGDNSPPRLPEDFAFNVHHECAWGCRGAFMPARYNSSRAKCIKCAVCGLFFSPNKFIFHSHRTGPGAKYVQPDAANFNSWRRHMRLSGSPPMEVVHAWEDVKAMFNGGTRKRLLASASTHTHHSPPLKVSEGPAASPPPFHLPPPAPTRVPPLPIVMDYVWHKHSFSPYSALPWLGLPPTSPLLLPPTSTPTPGDGKVYPSAFRPVYAPPAPASTPHDADNDDEETVDIETCPEDDVKQRWTPPHPSSQKPGTPTSSEPEVDVGSESTEHAAGREVTEAKSGAASLEMPQDPRLWSVARLPRDWPERTLYRQEVARQLSIMRDLVVPSSFTDANNHIIPFLPLQPPSDSHSRKFREKSMCSGKGDCNSCHHIGGRYSPGMSLDTN